jgi:hypothetical protein
MREYYTITDGTNHNGDHLVVQLLHQVNSLPIQYSCQNVKKNLAKMPRDKDNDMLRWKE